MWSSLASTFLAGIVAVGAPAAPPGASWVAPLASGLGSVLRGFERPVDRFAPGHRGVDFAAPVGTPVRAIGAGTVAHVGAVAGLVSVTVDHRVVRSSYLPIDPVVVQDQSVEAGQVIGYVSSSQRRHCPRSCLHLGIRRPAGTRDSTADPYVDPIAWIGRYPVLKPLT